MRSAGFDDAGGPERVGWPIELLHVVGHADEQQHERGDGGQAPRAGQRVDGHGQGGEHQPGDQVRGTATPGRVMSRRRPLVAGDHEETDGAEEQGRRAWRPAGGTGPGSVAPRPGRGRRSASPPAGCRRPASRRARGTSRTVRSTRTTSPGRDRTGRSRTAWSAAGSSTRCSEVPGGVQQRERHRLERRGTPAATHQDRDADDRHHHRRRPPSTAGRPRRPAGPASRGDRSRRRDRSGRAGPGRTGWRR